MSAPTTTEQSKPRDVLADVKRMLPVWALVFATTVGTAAVIRTSGTRYIERGLHASGDGCLIAQIHASAGGRLFRQLQEDVERRTADMRRTSPTKVEAASLGLLKGRSTEVAEARAHFLKAIELCPTSAILAKDLSKLAWWEGDAAGAHLRLGEYYEFRRDRAQAMAEYQSAVDAAPDMAEPRLLMAGLLLEDGRTTDALAMVPGLAGRAPDSRQEGLVAARLAMAEGRPTDARKLAADAYVRFGGSESLLRVIRDSFVAAPDPAGAGPLYASLSGSGGVLDAGVHHLAAISYNAEGNYQAAEPELRKAVALAPRNQVLLVDHAVALWRLGRQAEARSVWDKAVEIDPQEAIRLQIAAGVDPSKPPVGGAP